MKYKEAVFPELPLVFLGINKFSQQLIDTPGITGVFESRNLGKTLYELKQFTGSDEVIVISDSSAPGEANLSQITEIRSDTRAPSHRYIIPELKSDDIETALSPYKPDIPILLLGQIVDSSSGALLGWKDSTKRISEKVRNPLYTLAIATLEYGAVGAHDLLPHLHSHEASEIAIQILKGKPVESIKAITKAHSQWGFDWEKIQSQGISMEMLPPDSLFINDDPSFYQKYKKLVWLVTASFAIAILIILMLMEIIRRGYSTRSILEENDRRYTDLAQISSISFWETDEDLVMKYISGRLSLLRKEELLGEQTLFSLFSENPELIFPKEEFNAIIEQQKILENIIFEARSFNGNQRTFLLNAKPLYDKEKHFTGYRGICKEITEIQKLRTQLEHSQRMDAIGKLAGGIAHDFNNILGDAFLLQNALVNLGINASHAMPYGGTLTIRTGIETLNEDYCRASSFDLTPGSYVDLFVEDTGTGISGEFLPRIFEPFFTTKERGKGTGLGLSAVYGTVVQHQGEINVESESGAGTSFHMRFPLVEVSDVSEEINTEEDLKGEGTILIAEDDEVLRFGEMKSLESLGYSVITAKDGREAMEKYNEATSPIDLVILDMIMPEKNGLECFKELRQLSPNIPIILVSGCNREELDILKEDGLNAYVFKPFRRKELGSAVKRVLSNSFISNA